MLESYLPSPVNPRHLSPKLLLLSRPASDPSKPRRRPSYGLYFWLRPSMLTLPTYTDTSGRPGSFSTTPHSFRLGGRDDRSWVRAVALSKVFQRTRPEDGPIPSLQAREAEKEREAEARELVEPRAEGCIRKARLSATATCTAAGAKVLVACFCAAAWDVRCPQLAALLQS